MQRDLRPFRRDNRFSAERARSPTERRSPPMNNNGNAPLPPDLVIVRGDRQTPFYVNLIKQNFKRNKDIESVEIQATGQYNFF